MINDKSKFIKSFLILIFIVPVISLFNCAGNNRWATEIQWPGFELADLPGQQDFPDEGAVIVLDEGKMEIFGSGTIAFSEFSRHKIIKILNQQGERYANIMINYSPGVTVNDIQARTISPGGRITVLKTENIYDVNLYPNFVFYSDQRAKIFTMPAIEPGSIIEYEYRMNIQGRTLWHSWIFQDEIPTMLSRFTLIHPGEWDLNYRLYHLNVEPTVLEAPDGFKETRIWEAANLGPLISEFGMPPAKDVISRLSFAPVGIKTWDEVARWYDELASPRENIDEDMRALAQQLTEGSINDREKLQKIYEWVRDNIRYIAVEIGIGGFQPYPATEVLTNQYGDCKDMSTLLCALANAADIQCDQVLISTRNNGRPDTSLPSPFHFNHAIAYSPLENDSGLWMDATEKGCPFGMLPWYDQGVPVLVVQKGGEAGLYTTPVVEAEQNVSTEIWDVTLSTDGSAEIRGKMELKGAPATELREIFFYSSRKELRQWLEKYLAERFTGSFLDSFHIRGINPVEDPLQLEFLFRTNRFARQRDHALIFQPSDVILFRLPNYFRSPKRSNPIFFRFPLRNEQKFHIQMPAGYRIMSVSRQDTVESEFGKAWNQIRAASDSLFFYSAFQLDTTDIGPDDYSPFQEFLNSAQEMDMNELIFVKKDSDSTAAQDSN